MTVTPHSCSPTSVQYHATTTVTTHSDGRLKLLSLCKGSGPGTSSFLASEYLRHVMEIELEDNFVSSSGCLARPHNITKEVYEDVLRVFDKH